jgi:hypothetical protein
MSSPDIKITISEQVKSAMAADPKLGDALREMFAIFHQVHAGVESGQYSSFEAGIEALTGNRPILLDPDDLDDSDGSDDPGY